MSMNSLHCLIMFHMHLSDVPTYLSKPYVVTLTFHMSPITEKTNFGSKPKTPSNFCPTYACQLQKNGITHNKPSPQNMCHTHS